MFQQAPSPEQYKGTPNRLEDRRVAAVRPEMEEEPFRVERRRRDQEGAKSPLLPAVQCSAELGQLTRNDPRITEMNLDLATGKSPLLTPTPIFS